MKNISFGLILPVSRRFIPSLFWFFIGLFLLFAALVNNSALSASVNQQASGKDNSPTDVTLTIEASSSTINVDGTVDITGIVTLEPNNETTRKEFLEKYLMLLRTNPSERYEDIITTEPVLSETQIVFEFPGVKLPEVGRWTSLASFLGDESFNKGASNTVEIEVQDVPRDVAGYAIIVEGRVASGAGIDTHNLTTNYIYNKLLERGFTDDDIYYFNFQKQDGVDTEPSRSEVLEVISTWAREKMNKKPAPLYIVFVGHGEKERFFIYPDAIKAKDLANTLSSLESSLNQDASGQPIVVVLGFNRSGSFISGLSKKDKERIIITSADTKEVAYKGPLAPDEKLRHGDYFAAEFFKYAARGINLKKCYEEASAEIAAFTENGNGNGLSGFSAGNGEYFDNVAQHPLLDDNGDGTGTYKLLSTSGGKDGESSSGIVLGLGTASDQLELTAVTDVVALEAEDPAPELFAAVNDLALVNKTWIEIASPGFVLNNTEVTDQQIIELSRFSATGTDKEEKKYIWDDYSDEEINNFKNPGEYKILYLAEDENDDLATIGGSAVFRNKEGNEKPESFSPLSPADGAETGIALIFEWQESSDLTSSNKRTAGKSDTSVSAKKEVTYILTISQSSTFDTIDYQQKGITDNFAIVDRTAGLRNNTTYFWRVIASDADGGVTYITPPRNSDIHSIATVHPHLNLPHQGEGIQGDNVYSPLMVGGAVEGGNSTITSSSANGITSTRTAFYIHDANQPRPTLTSNICNATIQEVGGRITSEWHPVNCTYLVVRSADANHSFIVWARGYKTEGNNPRNKITVNANESYKYVGMVSATGKISGTVTVSGSSSRSGVKIELTKSYFSGETVTTKADGKYSFTGLEAGRYSLKATKSRYRPYNSSIPLANGQSRTVNITLTR